MGLKFNNFIGHWLMNDSNDSIKKKKRVVKFKKIIKKGKKFIR